VATAAAWRPVATALPSSWSAALAWLALASPSLHATELAPAARLVAAVTAWQHARIVARARGTTDVVAARADDWAPDLAPLLALPESQRRALAVALGAADERRPAAAPPSLYTPFGGLFLLLPRVAELPLADLWPDDAGGAHDLACTRLAVLARAAGAERAARVANDAVLRRILGVDAQLDLDDWLAANAAHLAAALPTLLAARSLPWARAVTLAIARWPAGDLMQIAIAEPEQEWLALAPLTAQLRTLLRAADASQPFDELPIVPEPTLPRAHALGRVLRHVVVATSAAPAAEPALALAAQHVLARFARRLPGFAASSPGFLFDNFLDADAVVVESGGSFHCRVGKPRLVALLGLTGALRGRTRITCGATTLELYPEG
ncbi:MAG TPA: hypothetical protein VIA18_29675, partial [Polyangia bacterium]|nr:hypothetical protein [Polyangia bacterium]